MEDALSHLHILLVQTIGFCLWVNMLFFCPFMYSLGDQFDRPSRPEIFMTCRTKKGHGPCSCMFGFPRLESKYYKLSYLGLNEPHSISNFMNGGY